ncbi:hypothetical protein L9F63_003403 [Diploptera punctata]|uniref:Uncharacterized protein n=1 Tax=Diploptera punctata TaxID=6984 RepID=A0AAD7ZK83_DIPPU|nr:hypothetical protein L9F63_003403 [Diploptera punctata]
MYYFLIGVRAPIINRADTLLKSPFSKVSIEEKLDVKRHGSHQSHDFKLHQNCNTQNKKIVTSCFERKLELW